MRHMEAREHPLGRDHLAVRDLVDRQADFDGYLLSPLPLGWQMDTIFILESLGVCWGLESLQQPQEQPIHKGIGREEPPR